MNNLITKEQIEQYYIEENHSQKESADYFNISVGKFNSLLKKFGIHKDVAKHVEQIKKAKLLKYGDENYNNREKASETCMERYGVTNPFQDTEKIKKSYIDKLGVDHPMHDAQIVQRVLGGRDYEEVWKKASDTYFEKTGYYNPSQNPEVIKKILQSKIDNGCFDTPGTSGLERRLEKILTRKFGEVISKYRDERYSRETGYKFECDFYIPAEDLFIELNAHPTHYNCPYNDNDDKHKKLCESYKNSTKKWETAIYETWVIRDTEKFNIAKEHQLNYLVLYPTNSIHSNKKFNDDKYSTLIEYLLKKLNKE